MRNENIIFLLLLFTMSCQETVEKHYMDYQSLVQDNYIQKGWIPDIIPKNSYNIMEIHNLDNNNLYGRFYFTEFNMQKGLKDFPLSEILRELSLKRLPKLPNWFIKLNGLKDNRDLTFKEYQNFRIIISRKNRCCYFYR